jgi:molecular chaperone GrpE
MTKPTSHHTNEKKAAASAASDASKATEEPAASPETESPETLRQETERLRDMLLRSQADLDNYRKRAAREKDDAIRYANSALFERLLPILDNFELGLEAARASTDATGIVQGMAMVQKQLQDFLAEQGILAIDATGAHFDPNLHEAVAHERSADTAEGTVLRQLRRGYKLKDRLLRPASVVVSKGSAPLT